MKRTITNLSWREALRTLLYTNNLVTIQADENGIVYLTKGYKDDEYFIIATDASGLKPEKEKITKVTALTMLSAFYKNTRREVTAAKKILDYIYMLYYAVVSALHLPTTLWWWADWSAELQKTKRRS